MIRDSWRDGINLNNSDTPHPDANGITLAAINSYLRGNGDEGIATNSDGGKSGKNSQVDGTRSVAPFWANAPLASG